MENARATSDAYRRFACVEARGKSPLYERLCEGVAGDAELLGFLGRLSPAKRQPNLVLAAVRHLFGTQPDYPAFRSAVLEHPAEVAELLAARRTQTNEPGRCAALLPVLAALPQPLALLEVGAAAGLCLLPDRYAYRYGTYRVGTAELVFDCAPHGPVPLPERLPTVVWRAGIDLEPVDLEDRGAVRWLEALVWPEEHDRLERLRHAIEIARRDPPRVVQGDLLEALLPVALEAPRDATLVVFHTAVLSYLSEDERGRFEAQVRSLAAEWISNESEGVLRGLPPPDVAPRAASHFLVSRNGERVVALCDPHGRWLQWTRETGSDPVSRGTA